MTEHLEYGYFLKELFPNAGPELLRLLAGAAENAMLLRSDFHTIRDWVEVAGCKESEEAHAILLLLLVALEEGSLCIEIAEPALVRRLRDFVPEAEATAWAQRIDTALSSTSLAALLGSQPGEHKPVIVHTVGERRFLYFQKYLRAELDFHNELTRRLAQVAVATETPWPTIVSDVFADQPLKLDRDQQLALGSALLNNVAIISGGPGTGKTSIVLTLLRCLIRGGVPVERIVLAAPTGRAAQRLTDSLRAGLARLPNAANTDSPDSPLRNLSATTLHRLLAFRPNRNVFSRHRENPIPADVVIVDEVSMVGLVLMSQLLQATPSGAKLILLGDKDQLPSVDAGAILASLVPEDFANGFHADAAQRLAGIFPDLPTPKATTARPLQDRVVLLQTNHRSQAEIRAAAQAINAQDATIVERLPSIKGSEGRSFDGQAGCFLLEQSAASASELRGFLQRWIEDAYFQSRLDGNTMAELLDAIQLDPVSTDSSSELRKIFTLLDRFRLLTLVREGAWGCDEINEFAAVLSRPRLDRDARSALFVGAPVLITRNDAARGLFNGDVGITLRDVHGNLRVVFERPEGSVAIPAESLPAHEMGFALTVHKSQGSEYQNVMVVVPPTGGRRLLTKELIYTAITRAKSLAVICSTKEALTFAVGRKIVRESGIIGV